jgi:hypothetical protein
MKINGPAFFVGAGLFLTGVALGVLYLDARMWQAKELELQLRPKPAIVSEVMDDGTFVRWGVAMMTGCTGVSFTGAGFILLFTRLKWFHTPAQPPRG